MSSEQSSSVDVPGIGVVTLDEELGWYRSQALFVPAFQRDCAFVLEGYPEDAARAQFHEAIANVLRLTPYTLQLVSSEVFAYYSDCKASWISGAPPCPAIDSAIAIWKHVQLGRELMVARRGGGDECVYVSIECECDWEPEHGLQLVLRDGLRVTKVGPYDGHLTNSDAFARPDLENVIYAQVSI